MKSLLVILLILIPQLQPYPETTEISSGNDSIDISVTPDEIRILAGETGYISIDFINKENRTINITMLLSITSCCGSPNTNATGISYFDILPNENERLFIEVTAYNSLPSGEDVDDINIIISWMLNSTVGGNVKFHIEFLTDFIYVILPTIIFFSVLITLITSIILFAIILHIQKKKPRKTEEL